MFVGMLPSSTTINNKSTTGESKQQEILKELLTLQLEKESSRRFSKNYLLWTFYKMYRYTVSVIPASHIFFNCLKIALPFMY